MMGNTNVYLVTLMHEIEDLHISEIFSNFNDALQYKKELSESHIDPEWSTGLYNITVDRITPNIKTEFPSNNELYLTHIGCGGDYKSHVFEIFSNLNNALQHEKEMDQLRCGMDTISGFGKIVMDRMVSR